MKNIFEINSIMNEMNKLKVILSQIENQMQILSREIKETKKNKDHQRMMVDPILMIVQNLWVVFNCCYPNCGRASCSNFEKELCMNFAHIEPFLIFKKKLFGQHFEFFALFELPLTISDQIRAFRSHWDYIKPHLTNYDHFEPFWQFLTILNILTTLDNFWPFLTVYAFVDYFNQLWTFFYRFKPFGPSWTILDRFGLLWTNLDRIGWIWTILDHIRQLRIFFDNFFFYRLDHFSPFLTVFGYFG